MLLFPVVASDDNTSTSSDEILQSTSFTKFGDPILYKKDWIKHCDFFEFHYLVKKNFPNFLRFQENRSFNMILELMPTVNEFDSYSQDSVLHS